MTGVHAIDAIGDGRRVAPSDCAVLVGIPTDERSFRAHLATPVNRDFVVNRVRSWSKYHHEFAEHFEPVADSIAGCGTTIIRDASLESLSVACTSHKVVVLVAHWTGHAVEFADGLEESDRVIAAVPGTFSGVLDLCACHPLPLVIKLRQDRPDCLIKFINRPATPLYWLYFYQVLFALLSAHALSYSQALEQTTTRFLGARVP